MTIELVTGLPGNGKTLYSIAYVKDWAERENRQVYYSGIKDLTLPWTEIEPEKWYDCPAGSIIVIDECQRVFRPRSVGKEPPEHVSRLETHRHQGLDIVLITQHPLLADSAIRRLVGKHMHVVRTFGTHRATIHEWGSVKDTCDKTSGRSDSIKHFWKYPKEVFTWYKSAEQHTVKRNIPMRFWFLISVPVLLFVIFIYVKAYLYRNVDKAQPDQVATVDKTPAKFPSDTSAKGATYKNAVEESKQYVYLNTERVEGLPHTAPKYDELTQPTVAPVPAGCVQSASMGCKCYSQQATPIAMPDKMCREIVKHGWFEDFDTAGKQQRRHDTDTERSEPKQVAMRDDSGPVVLTFGNPKQERQTGKQTVETKKTDGNKL